MSSHGHKHSSPIRPGSFDFPVVTNSTLNLRGGIVGNWVTPLLNLQAGTLAALFAVLAFGQSLSGSAPTIAACALILLLGLPHGSLDLEIIRRERQVGGLAMGALLLVYLGLAGAMAAVWQLAPVAALSIFLIVAVVHFAEDWRELKTNFLAQGMAIALLAAPTLLHLAEIEQLFIALSGQREGALVANFLLLLAPMSVAVASVSVWTLWRTGFRDQAWAGAMTLVGMILLPPVVGFAVFFCCYHSPRHLSGALLRVNHSSRLRSIILLVTLAALGITAALFANVVRIDLPAQAVAVSFMTLSLLTVPHMIVPAVADALASRRLRRADRRGPAVA
jgi:Brp/Blh family beta-carotene 15,15'-monooxygenase